MRGARVQYEVGRYAASAPTESNFILGRYPTFRPSAGRPTLGVIFCHGSGETVEDVLMTAARLPTFELLAGIADLDATVIAAKLNGDKYGNATTVDRVHDAVTYLRNSWGVVGPVGLVGVSMGAASALNYAKAHPTEVAWVAGIIPLTNLQLLHDTNAGHAAALDLAYPPAFSDAAFGADYDPIVYASTLPADLPIKLWYAPNDSIVPSSTVTAFQTARPATEIEATEPLDHTDLTVADATPSILDWIASL